jgi:hypothetical protein
VQAAGPSHDAVRAEVQELLDRSPAFRALPAAQQQAMRDDMTKVGAFLADPGWLEKTPPLATGMALGIGSDPVGSLKQKLADGPGQAGKDFKAGAVKQATQEFGRLVKKVDFPKFVSGLVKGVFNAVVDASIQQMQAYGELLSAVSKSVGEFAQDNISEGQARDHVASRYPSAVEIDTSGEGRARLRARADQDQADVLRAFNLPPGTDISDEAGERKLMMAARMQMAQSRQRLLATMVLMGINRIVVTNGKINAKVLFDVEASDELKRHQKAAMHDKENFETEANMEVGGFASFFGIGGSAHTGYEHATTVESALQDDSESKAKMKAQLSGEVSLQFKSETFPLERMADVGQIQSIAQQPGTTTAPAAAPAPVAR